MVVAVLLSTSDRVMVTAISTARIAHAGMPSVKSTINPAIKAVPPAASSAAPSGIIEPKSTTTGHSM